MDMPAPLSPDTRASYVSDEGVRFRIVAIVGPIVATLFLLPRLYSRKFIVKGLWWDDGTLPDLTESASQQMTDWLRRMRSRIAFSACGAQMIELGLGLHIWEIPESDRGMETWMKYYTATMALHMVAMGAVKVSILLLYLRVLAVRRSVQIIIWIHLVAVVITSMCGAIIYSVTCHQVTFMTGSGEKQVQCVRRGSLALTAAAVNLATDITTLGISLPLVWKLKLPLRKRIGVIGVLSTGIIVCVVSSARLAAYIHHLHDPDASYTTYMVLMMGTVEMNTAIICSCLPALPALVKRYPPRSIFSRRKPDAAPSSDKNGSHRDSLVPITSATGTRSHTLVNPSRKSSDVDSSNADGDGSGITVTTKMEMQTAPLTPHTPTDRHLSYISSNQSRHSRQSIIMQHKKNNRGIRRPSHPGGSIGPGSRLNNVTLPDMQQDPASQSSETYGSETV